MKQCKDWVVHKENFLMPGDKVFDGRLKELRSLQNPGYVRLVTLMVGACSLRVKKVVGKNFNSTSLKQ